MAGAATWRALTFNLQEAIWMSLTESFAHLRVPASLTRGMRCRVWSPPAVQTP